MENNKLIIKLKSISYLGDSVGNDIVLEIKIRDRVFAFTPPIKLNDTLLLNSEISRFDLTTNKFEENILIKITEKDILFDDVGEINQKINVDLTSPEVQEFVYEIKVKELGTNFRRNTAIFQITLVFEKASNDLFMGKIVLYPEIEQTDFLNLRSSSDPKSEEINKLKNGDAVEILGTDLEGVYVQNKSKVWYRVKYQEFTGYILSTFIELVGQERKNVILKIREQAIIYGVDSDLAVALAGCESHYKPYARSYTGARGIFQLTGIALRQLNKELNYKINDKDDKEVYDIDKNINGGIIYLGWICGIYKDKQDGLKKIIAAWNVGQSYIPKKGTVTFEKIKNPKKKAETMHLVECVMGSLKK